MNWFLIVMLNLPAGPRPEVLAAFKNEATCEAFRTKLAFQNPDGSPAATFCRRSWRT